MTATSSPPGTGLPVRRALWPALVASGWLVAVLVHVVRPSDQAVAVALISIL
jgi:hypothetical protein